MSTTNEPGRASRARCYADPDASPHDLLNNAAELLQYARGLTELLAEFVHESDTVDCRRMALSLDAIAALTQMGAQCAAEAHARLAWTRRADGSSCVV
ncbi:MAG TPA: hypothetical protein VM621_00730 [Luteibacter sp.]|uniref:hypothetical protein n=1 Tax=Luteibacter sp. TaxID=1886636 RepID=UPI002CB9C5DD|nr:hypothetical protein [Luteibacter sp.]HVI53558.1 hypothetical protein [Luteibacter sp.]